MRYKSEGYGISKTERVSADDYLLTRNELVGIALDSRLKHLVHLDDRKIGGGVHPLDLTLVKLAVTCLDSEIVSVLKDVVVGHDDAVTLFLIDRVDRSASRGYLGKGHTVLLKLTVSDKHGGIQYLIRQLNAA